MNSTTQRLPIPDEVVGLSRKQVLDLLGVKPSTLKEYQWILNELKPSGWEYEPHSRGLVRSSIEVLWNFKNLIKTLGKTQAIAKINQVMENLNNA